MDKCKIKKMSPQLVVADIERAINFYTDKLGFIIDFRYEDFYAGVSKDGHAIHLKAGLPSAEERKSRRENENVDILFSVDGIDNFYKELIDKSVNPVQPLRNMAYGKEFYIADPDGYIIAFLEQQ